MSEREVLRVLDISVAVAGRQILSHISFSLEPGKTLAVVGPNGAGKSTLLRALGGLLPSKGEILLAGRKLSMLHRKETASLLAYVPQGLSVEFPLSVREFVMAGRYPYLSRFSKPGAADEAKVEEVLQLTNSQALSRQCVTSLSGGERQRVLIAAALAQEPQLLLLDEPTAFLDPKMQREILSLLKRLSKENGLAILSVSHDINSALENSDEILALKSGTINFYGNPEEFGSPQVLSGLYGMEFTMVHHPSSKRPMAVPNW